MVEVLVAMSLGLFVIGGIAAAYVNNQRTRAELERSSRQLENGRYAVQLLSDELRHAGYFGEFDPRPLPSPPDLIAACETDLDTLRASLPVALVGIDDTATTPSCLSDVKTGTDIVVLKRTTTCVAGAPGCEATASGEPYLQASLCSTQAELESPAVENRFRLSTSAAALDRHARDCSTTAPLRRFVVRIYYIANNNEAGDGIPTLKRAELKAGSFAVEPLVEGIEDLQLQYGIDSDGDSVPNAYSTNPSTYDGCATNACKVQNWRDVTAVKLHLLARNIESSPGFKDSRTYLLGHNDDGSQVSVGPFNDAFPRHVYSTSVRASNLAGRRE
ncbi:MAG: PilW family protein [Burkholderiaceae bacterium]|nr:PilW family protein [Burkholderiaceae bacterium]